MAKEIEKKTTKKAGATAKKTTAKTTTTVKAKTDAVKKDTGKNLKLTIEVKAFYKPETIYVIGNTSKLGAWNLAKAIEIKKTEDGNYVKTISGIKEDGIEFKVLHSLDWCNVEKGIFAEEIDNHYVCMSNAKTTEVTITVFNWA